MPYLWSDAVVFSCAVRLIQGVPASLTSTEFATDDTAVLPLQEQALHTFRGILHLKQDETAHAMLCKLTFEAIAVDMADRTTPLPDSDISDADSGADVSDSGGAAVKRKRGNKSRKGKSHSQKLPHAAKECIRYVLSRKPKDKSQAASAVDKNSVSPSMWQSYLIDVPEMQRGVLLKYMTHCHEKLAEKENESENRGH